MRVIVPLIALLLATGATAPPTVVVPVPAPNSAAPQAIPDSASPVCRERIQEVRRELGKPELQRDTTPQEPLLIAAVDKRIGGCSVLVMRNDTSEHIDSALKALISDVETALVNGGHVRVISAEDQPELIEKVRQQNSDAFDQSQIASWGQQVGAKYFVTGKVYSVDERHDDERRVQYFLFMRVLEAATGDILWQNKQAVTKALIN